MKPNLRYLQLCADYIRSIPDEHWDFGILIGINSCKTTGCAAGHLVLAGMIPGYCFNNCHHLISEKTGENASFITALSNGLGLSTSIVCRIFLHGSLEVPCLTTQSDIADRLEAEIERIKSKVKS